MSDSFTARMKEIIRRAGGQDELADRSGVPKNTIAKYAVGRSEPNVTRLIALADAAYVSVEWLAKGTEPRPKIIPNTEEDPGSYAASQVIETLMEEFALVSQLDVEVSAGSGTELAWPEEETSTLAFLRKYLKKRGINPDDARLVTARGDSMEPTISDGDTVLVDTSVQELLDDSIYCIQVGGRARAKRLQRDMRGGVWVISDNEQYEDEHLTAAEAAELKVVGKVVWVGRDV